MNFRRLGGAALSAALALGMSAGLATAQDTGVKQDFKNAGHDTKNAAVDTGHGIDRPTSKAFHKTKHGTKKAYHKTKYHSKRAAHKVHRTLDPDSPPSR